MRDIKYKIIKNVKKINEKTTDIEYEKFLKKTFGNVAIYNSRKNGNFLHALSNSDLKEDKLLLILKYVINKYKYLLNWKNNNNKETFIHTLIKSNYSNSFIYEVLNETIETHVLDINSKDKEGYTIFHCLLENTKKIDSYINKIYDLLDSKSFNSYAKTKDDETILDILESNINILENDEYYKFIENFHKRTNNEFNNDLKSTNYKLEEIKDELDDLKIEATIMNDKVYKTNPSIGRKIELEQLMVILANKRKNPIIVGESGVGKTTLVDELIYRIQNNEVKDFLKDKIIIELNATTLISGTNLRGSFEKKVKDICELCIENDIILFIDEIHEIYGAGSSLEDKSNDMSSMIKYFIDRRNLKVIGTTTKEEYNKYFSKDALKRRFEMIEVKEPDKILLKEIIYKVLCDMSNEYKINIDIINENIIDILINLTTTVKKYNDKLNNPDLVISIIDDAFSYAYYESTSELSINDLIKAIKINKRLYESTKERYINKLINIKQPTKDAKTKVLNFSDYVRK